MEQLTFMVELNWKMYSEKLDKILARTEYLIQFNQFLNTETGQKWLTSENGKKFIAWQES